MKSSRSSSARVTEEEKKARLEDIRIIIRQLEEAKLALQQNVEVEEDEEEVRNALRRRPLYEMLVETDCSFYRSSSGG